MRVVEVGRDFFFTLYAGHTINMSRVDGIVVRFLSILISLKADISEQR